MRDILDGLIAWRARGERFALATVVQTWSSAPRPPGATMAVSARGEVLGSISGGCVEGDTYELARQVIDTGRASLARFGVTDDDAFAVGLTCGGVIDVFVEPISDEHHPDFDEVLAAIKAHRPVVTATITSGPATGQHLALDGAGTVPGRPGRASDRDLLARMAAMLTETTTATVPTGGASAPQGSPSAFLQSFAPPPRMIVFGAIDFAGAVADIGKFLGYHVTLCDARAVFTTPARFPRVDSLVVDWPHRYLQGEKVEENTVLCVLTHDPKFDVPLLKLAVATPARYIGVMGSRRAHARRIEALRAEGVSEQQLDRLRSPIGLDLDARTPEETAVSIAAEIIAVARGATGAPLRELEGSIHR